MNPTDVWPVCCGRWPSETDGCCASHGSYRHVCACSAAADPACWSCAGRDLERELATLEQVSWLYPDAATVLVGDSDPPWLAGLAWDLGARWVLLPPQSRERLTEIVTGLMGRYQPASAAAGGGP